MIPINKLTPDSACKAFFRNSVYFASFCNAVLFDGKQIIDPEKLEFYETDLSTIIIDKEAMDMKRYRDVLRKVEINGSFTIIGIENQSTIDSTMLVRCGTYDWLGYVNELKSKKAHEKLTQRVTVVFYTGADKWNAEKRLQEMVNKVPGMENFFNDWNYIIIDAKEMDTSKIKDEETCYFVEAIQAMYEGNYESLERIKKMKKENFIYASAVTGSLELIKDIVEGDEIDMCEGMERMAEGFRREGRTQGREEGKLEEKQNMLNELLKVKLGSLSSNLENQLSNTSIEKLNVLTHHIFNINNEDDVLRIIH